MRGLLPGSKKDDVRISSKEIHAPRFSPTPSGEDLLFLRELELGKVRPPRILIDSDFRLIITEVKGVKVEENWRNWKIVNLASFSYVPVKMLSLSHEEGQRNVRKIQEWDIVFQQENRLERGYQQEGEEEEEYPVVEEDNLPPPEEELEAEDDEILRPNPPNPIDWLAVHRRMTRYAQAREEEEEMRLRAEEQDRGDEP